MQYALKVVLTLVIILLVLTDLVSIICIIDNLSDLSGYLNNPNYFNNDESFGSPKFAMDFIFAIGFISAMLAYLLVLLIFKHIGKWFRQVSLILLPLLLVIANIEEILMR